MKNRLKLKSKNNSGFIVADFLFAFVMVIGIGMFMFALTFSLATIEVGQYIVWSTAHNYGMANTNEQLAREQAANKFEVLSAKFPLLTNSDGNSGWFDLSASDLKIGNLSKIDNDLATNLNADSINDNRQPWTGASTNISLKLFSGLQIPFLGKVAVDKSIFTFPIRAFIIRNVSKDECKTFFYQDRWEKGFNSIEGGRLAPAAFGPQINGAISGDIEGWGEDNGC